MAHALLLSVRAQLHVGNIDAAHHIQTLSSAVCPPFNLFLWQGLISANTGMTLRVVDV